MIKIRGYIPKKPKPLTLEETVSQKLRQVDDKIQEVDTVKNDVAILINESSAKVEETISEFKKAGEAVIAEIKSVPPIPGETGPAGQDADEERIVENVLTLLPEQEKFIAKIISLIPAPIPLPSPTPIPINEEELIKKVISKIPENKASLKIIQKTFETDPMSVIEKIMAMPEGKFKLKTENIDGLEQTIQAFRSQLSRGYLHGGGISDITGLIQAGSNITITGAGTKASPYVINASGGGGSVASVTGLNTDNSDPTNPIVKISVDGVTITGAGTPGDPLVASATPITGADTQVLFFDGANNPAGDAGFTYNKTTDIGTIGGLIVTGGTIQSTSGVSLNISTPNSNSSKDIVFQAGDAASGNNNGGNLSFAAGQGSGSGFGGDLGFTTDNDNRFIISPAGADNGVFVKSGGGTYARFDTSGLSTIKTFTFPNTSGTFALLSNLSAYVPTSRTITINGSGQDLSADRTYTITTTGTANRISVSNGATTTPTIDIAATYVGQSSITTLGTIGTGTWNANAIALGKGGTGQALVDPGANNILAWDDTDNTIGFWTLGSGLTYTHATHTLSATGTGGTVTSVASADGSITVTNPNTTVDLAVVKSPKLSTARNIGGVSFDGTGDIVPQTIQTTDETSDTTCFILFITASGSQSLQPHTNTNLTYDASANVLTANSFATSNGLTSAYLQNTNSGSVNDASISFLGVTGVNQKIKSTSMGTLTAGNSIVNFVINQSATEASSGVHALIAGIAIKNPTITNGTATSTNYAAIYIEGATNQGTATITNNYSIWVDAGEVRFDGDIGDTTNRVVKGWFTDLTSTNAITASITGNAATATNVAVGGITGLGTGVATALAVNVGSAGAFITFNGDAGTPSALVGTNISGTGASFTAGTATVANTVSTVNEATDTTCFILFVTASGTQSLQPKNNTGLTYNSNTNALTATTFIGALTGNASTATNVAVGGITGLGTGVATALAVNVGSAGAFVVLGGALGTPSSGTGTNITGIPAANILAGSFGAGAYVISTSLQVATIELGAATDTTLSRVSAGKIAVEGVTLLDTTNISDTAYASSWDGVTTIAPSKNAVYDKIQTLVTRGQVYAIAQNIFLV